ncbi:hypothetical protein NQ315_017062 [Exocentrus adspersus]|uniref:Uncharacterized protein n=1 Tax=Exocentrus adspersus TaxID=1586481 RepID=A0AAV8VHG2_9CUCU|nr:hypothetical protein NQ315_017062 [Exocentrus adspersus]
MEDVVKQSPLLDYLIEENRRKTFKKWVFSKNNACNADKMAEAGFIFVGNRIDNDSVKCFLCNKALEGWEPTDDPWQEHLKHSPNCALAKLRKPMMQMTLNEFLDIRNALIESVISSYFDKYISEIDEKSNKCEKMVAELIKTNSFAST